jgi:hypothetical protein
MVKISKEERDYLERNGCVFPDDLHRTVGKGKRKTYYATENYKVKQLLAQRKRETLITK